MSKKLLILMMVVIMILMALPIVSSAPPVTTIQQFTEGFIIEGSPTEYIKQNENYTFNFFLYNISDGRNRGGTGISCLFYLADNKGTLKYSGVPAFASGYYSIVIHQGNFSKVGHYPYGVNCNSSSLGGASVSYWEVTPNGLELTIARAFVDIGLLIVLVIFLIGCVVLFMENDNLLAKVGFLGLGYLMLMAITFVSWNMASDFLLSAPFIASMFRLLFFVLIIGTFPLLLGGFAWYIIMLIRIKEIQRMMDKGMPYEEAERRRGRKYQ